MTVGTSTMAENQADPHVLYNDNVALQNARIEQVTLNSQTGTTYTLALTDEGKMVQFNNASAMELEVPANATVAFAIGNVVHAVRWGAGSLTIAAAVGVTLRSAGSVLTVADQYGVVTMQKVATNEWLVYGGLG